MPALFEGRQTLADSLVKMAEAAGRDMVLDAMTPAIDTLWSLHDASDHPRERASAMILIVALGDAARRITSKL